MYYVAFPFVYISRGITFFFRKNGVEKISRDEILSLMELGKKSGSLDALEMDILEHIIGQKSIRVKNIMTPKNLVFTLDENLTLTQALAQSQKHKYSRIPLIDSAKQITSIAYRKDILRSNLKNKDKEILKNIAKPFNTVQENKQVLMLLRLFILRHAHLFIVLDKKGDYIGIVTLEDALKAVLGVGNLSRH